MTVPNRDPISAAVDALRAFGPLGRPQAATLLAMWSRAAQLTPTARETVLDLLASGTEVRTAARWTTPDRPQLTAAICRMAIRYGESRSLAERAARFGADLAEVRRHDRAAMRRHSALVRLTFALADAR